MTMTELIVLMLGELQSGARDWISLRPGVLARWAVLLAFARQAYGR